MTSFRRYLHWSVAVALLGVSAAKALPPYGPLQITGSVQSQTLIRDPDIDEYQFIQNRNTLRLRLDYEWLHDGQWLDTFSVPWVRTSHLFLLYRGVYDSAYDIAPGGNLRGIFDTPVLNPLGSTPNVPNSSLADIPSATRNGLKFEDRLREAYIDLDLRDLPLSFRLGRQQVVWGETDNFRMLDRANPLDLTWHQTYESWDDLRIPLWMIKGLWRIGQVGPLSDTFIESYWDPGDWAPAKQGFMPEYPWGIPSSSPLNQLSALGYRALYHGTTLFDQGDYVRNPIENSQLGARVSFVIPQGVQFTLNYFYQRWAGDDGTNYAAVKGLAGAQAKEAVKLQEAPAEFIAPYVHTVGMSMNYSEEDYTQTVYRMETVYDFGVPFSDTAQPSAMKELGVFGVTKRDMWKGMVAFDRPTWIRPLNRISTWFISGQFFWHYLIDRKSTFVGGVDPYSFPTQVGSRTINPDRVREWETVATLIATTFYSGGKTVPMVMYGIDPTNTYNMYVGWTIDRYLTNNLIVRIGQNFFLLPGKPPAFESWSIGGFNRGRSESIVRVTYQF